MSCLGANQQEIFVADVNQEAWFHWKHLEDFYYFVIGQRFFCLVLSTEKTDSSPELSVPPLKNASDGKTWGVHWYWQHADTIFLLNEISEDLLII